MPVLIFLFLVLPILELWVIIEVGGAIGVLPTLALLFLDGFIGAALARTQGAAVWRRFNKALAEGRMPGREVFDGAAVIMGGSMLIAPGFLTDILGISLLAPPTRALLRRFLMRFVKRRGGAPVRVAGWTYARTGGSRGGAEDPFGGPAPTSTSTRGYDVEGSGREIADDDLQLGRGGDDG